MKSFDYLQLDGCAIASKIKAGALSPEEAVQFALNRIEALNPSLGAVSLLAPDLIADQISALDPRSPFAGVPFLMKDLGAGVAGLPTHAGSRYFLKHGSAARRDDDLTASFRKAGFVILGKTAVPEFGLNLTTEPLSGPACRNPWDQDFSAGGSSGGAAAAVGSGMVPLAHATDAGGSIRVPAAACGLIGLKPGRGRNPEGPGFANHLMGLTSEHVITRSVRDSAAVLAVTAVPQDLGPEERSSLAEEAVKAVSQTPKPTRIALVDAEGGLGSPSADLANGLKAAAVCLEDAGHEVGELKDRRILPLLRESTCVFQKVIWANLAFEFQSADPPPSEEDLEPLTWAALERGRRLSAKDLVSCERSLLHISYEVNCFFKEFDFLLMPSLAKSALKLGALPSDHRSLETHFERLRRFAPFSVIFNVSGHPAISFPYGLGSQDMPIGLQLVGPMLSEERLLQLAGFLIDTRPWPKQPPWLCGEI